MTVCNLCIANLYAQTKLPTFFSDGMVLQQTDNVNFWGVDEPGKEVVVSATWGATASTVTNQNGKWTLKIATPKAGGPFEVSVQGSEEKLLSDVLIGEVWFCSGQSNMAMKVKAYSDKQRSGSNEAILHSKNNKLRFFQTKRVVSLSPLDDVKGEWLATEPSTVSEFSATTYFFAKSVHETLHVPVGIIESTWGGSALESWMSKESLSGFDEVAVHDEYVMKAKYKQPTTLYNAMTHPFLTYNIKGVLWYQGETNHDKPELHSRLFPAMIESLRKAWEVGNFPFYFVQLAPFKYNNSEDCILPLFWESQLKTLQQTENTGMVVTLDIGNCKNIHPKEKKKVGDRLAYWALAKTYGINGISYSGPIYKNMEILPDNEIKINFDQADLTSFHRALTGFEIAGKNKVFYPATAEIFKGKFVTVRNAEVQNPVAVRYAFHNCAEASLFNNYGLPASSFRTDDWD